jgi:hypothetical protein
MRDPIETRLVEYFGRFRPNAGPSAEVRLVAALDRAAVRPAHLHVVRGPITSALPGGVRRFAILVTAAVAIVAVAATYGLWASHPGPAAVSPSPTGNLTVMPFATPSVDASTASPATPPASLAANPTEPPGPNAVAPSRGWMTQWRDYAAAARLLDGRVLIVGGVGGDIDTNVDLASAELFDPKTKTFRATGSMYQTYGKQATATTLLDGRVLVVGGTDLSGLTESMDAELFNPATGTFAETGQPLNSTWYHTATRLEDGRVLIIGGEALNLGPGAATQLYDPATGRFTRGPSMPPDASPDIAVLLTDGRVLVVGQRVLPDGSGGPDDVAELYDPASETFSPTGAPVSRPETIVGTVLADGRVCIAGGGLIQIYNPATGKFTRAGTLAFATRPQGAIALENGRVLITYLNDNNRTYRAQVFNPATGKSLATGPMVESRTMYTTTLLLDGRVLIAGSTLNYRNHNVGELFDPRTNTFLGTDK